MTSVDSVSRFGRSRNLLIIQRQVTLKDLYFQTPYVGLYVRQGQYLKYKLGSRILYV